MKILEDIYKFVSTLNLADFIFFFAILILMILIITLIYFIKINEDNESNLEETAEMKIVKELDKYTNEKTPTIPFTEYEKDQENKAIISYDELKNKKSSYEVYQTKYLNF